jgi:toluene monooxygenase system ferredoxin subunit
VIDTGVREDEMWIGEMRAVVVAGCPVLLVRHESGMSAFGDRCPHQGYPLSEGELRDGVLTCRAHQHCFDAVTGDGINPQRPSLVRLPLVLSQGAIQVEPPARRALP